MSRKPTNCRVTMPMLRRMEELRAAGLSANATQAVIRLDFGVAPCERTIRRYTSHCSNGSLSLEMRKDNRVEAFSG